MAINLETLRVLVIDDNAQMRSIVGTVLTGGGVRQLYYAPDGRRGLEVVEGGHIDVVYVDYEMPVLDGLDFISIVRSLDSAARYLPIIMLTGHSDTYRLNEARDRGVTEFLCKPVTARDILKRLEAVIMHPRPFVETDAYFGPDRRRKDTRTYSGPLRRAADHVEAPERTSPAPKAEAQSAAYGAD